MTSILFLKKYKWVIDLNVKVKAVQILEENMGKCLLYYGGRHGFLRLHQKL